MRIPILLLLLFTITTCSDLSSIVSDLSTLSRITNAIALQNSVLQKTLNLPEVVAELLKVDPVAFNAVMGLNTTFVKAEYQKFYDIVVEMLNTPRLVRSYVLKDFKSAIRFLKANIQNFLETESNGRSFKATKIIDLLKKPLGQFTELPCTYGSLNAFTNFFEVLSNVKKVDPIIEKDYLLRMKFLQKEMYSCFQRCQTFKEEKRDEVYQELVKMKSAFVLANVLEDYGKQFDTLIDFTGILSNMTTDIERTRGLDQLSHKISGQIRKAAYKNLDIVHVPFEPIPAVTSGFPEGLEDLVKVAGDLKGSWFQKHVSRGKNANVLVLGEFFRLAEHLAQLKAPWEEMIEPGNMEDLKTIGSRTLETLGSIEAFPETQATLNLLEASQKTFSKCFQNANTINVKLMSDIKKRWHLPAVVLNDMENVMESAESIGKGMELKVFADIFGDMMERIPDSKRFDDDKILEYKGSIGKHNRIDDIWPVFQKIQWLFKAQNDYVNGLRNFKNAQNDPKMALEEDTFNLEKIVKDSNILTIIECLKTEGFEAAALARVEEFLEAVRDAISKDHFEVVLGFLKRVEVVQAILEKAGPTRVRRATPTTLPEAQSLSLHLSEGLAPIRQMVYARAHRELLLNSTQYSNTVTEKLHRVLRRYTIFEFWKDPGTAVGRTLRGMDALNEFATNLTSDLHTIREIFKEAEKVPGIAMYEEVFQGPGWALQSDIGLRDVQEAVRNSERLGKWDLDFAKSKKSLSGAYMVVKSLSGFFDEIFGFVKKPNQQQVHGPQKHVIIEPSVSYWAVVGMCFGFFALCILVGVIGYGFTKNGRTKYWNTYLYYFPSDKEFEKRWRYSLFMDRENGQNALIDASREINSINVKNILERGAYVNVYSPFGNTALHMATKRGFPKVVELLIRNGADRSLVNAQNLIAEQTIPANYRETRKEEADKYAQIEAIYEATRNKKYRIRVPQQMPSHLFHIYIESRTDNSLTNKFTEKYPGITSDEPLPTTTHCICKTSDSGILETDDVDLLAWIFLGVIMVKESWMTDCVRDDKMIRRDDKHLIEDVRFHGTLYENCVGQWSQAMAKSTMPYLYGAYFVFVMKDLTRVPTLTMIINTLGGVFLEEFAAKDTFNAGACPYLHTNLGPAFVIHDGQTDLSGYKNDKMYTLFTDTQFIGFLLKRDIHRDTSPNPIPQLAE